MFKSYQNKFSYIVLITLIAIFCCGFCRTSSPNMTGVYWGAFDPPTGAHAAIIVAAVNDIPLKKLIVVVNNHQYKNYTYPLAIRMQLIGEIIQSNGLENVEILWQDDTHKIDFWALRKMTLDPLCAVAGYDSYKKWVDYSSPQERSAYDAIAVVPRGDDQPLLYDENAFILPINEIYKHVSSTQIRESLDSPK